MATLRVTRGKARQALEERVKAANDLTAKAEIAERTALFDDWLQLFAKWRQETITV